MVKLSEKILFTGNWITLKEAQYRNREGKTVKWESIERVRENLAIVILATLKPSDRIVLIRQFRHSIEGYILGLPAGLINSNLDNQMLEYEILKELEEETGYIGTIIEMSPILKGNSGIMNSSSMVVNVIINEEAEINRNPIQKLEPSEEIDVILIKKSEIKDFLIGESNKGINVGAGLWYLFGVWD